MTRRRAPDPAELLATAADAYHAQFGAAALPQMLFLPTACMATAARVLRAAVARGRPVRQWTVARCCGIRQPPDAPGVLL
jgi:hypothetical protein